MTSGLALERLSFSYPQAQHAALTDVDLQVSAGEVLAVVGPSGSGKSTLLKVVNGLLTATAGVVRIGGVDVSATRPESRPVATVFQGYALFPHLSVHANIGFGLAVRKVGRDVRRDRVQGVAAQLGLVDLLPRYPHELSGGERQRVALARALLHDPAVFCLDEPLSALDPVLRTTARRELEQLLREGDRCALYVTHDQAEAMVLGDRVALLKDGRVVQAGTPRELYDDPATTFVATFIGTHPMSVVSPSAARVTVDQRVASVGVRAEHVDLVPGDDAVIAAVDDLGHEQIVLLDLGGERLAARVSSSERRARGERTGFAIQRYTPFDAEGSRVG